jgi:peptidyl-prolyl cis-trans isomerase A (cyclophilin A)
MQLCKKSTTALSAFFILASLSSFSALAKDPGKEAVKTSSQKTSKSSSVAKTAIIETSEGNITVRLFADKAPKTIENFVGLATGKKEWKDPETNQMVTGKPLYSGTVFHRVIPDFMIQGGDPKGNGTGGPGYEFADEVKPTDDFNKEGILAMANAGPNTNGSQFFITVKPTPWLNGHHTIFGEVTQGMDVVKKIANAEKGPNDVPKKTITIKKIEIQS